MVLWGKNSFFPLCALSKKQGCVSHSTSEAEVVALNSIVRTMLIPSLDLWETILQKKVLPIVYEDNQATAKIIRSGKFEKLRHVDRTHGVQLSFITEQLRAGRYELKDCHTRAMAADVFTKFFVNKDKWEHAITLIGMWREGVSTTRKGVPPTIRKDEVPSIKSGGIKSSCKKDGFRQR